jgi:hypothetical protein
MKTLKYIRFDTRLADTVFLFPAWDNHADVAFKLRYKPVSAGFAHVGVDADGMLKVVTYGRSESLNLESEPADAELILEMLKNS